MRMSEGPQLQRQPRIIARATETPRSKIARYLATFAGTAPANRASDSV